MRTRFLFYKALFFQLLRFGVVGLSAALLHFSLVVLAVEWQGLPPLVANVIAFCFAFPVSYWGHRYWTFRDTQQAHLLAFSKLLLVSTMTFVANEGLFYLLMVEFHLPYRMALVLVLSVLPLVVFTVNKLWVFEGL